MARIGFDGLMISPCGKGHARSQRHAAEALGAHGAHEVVVFVREPMELANVEVVTVHPRLTIDWELRGLPRAARRLALDVFVTLSERLPFTPSIPIVVWLFESPVHRIRHNRAARARARHLASDLITAALWRRSLGRAAHVAFGSRATADEVLAELPHLNGRTSVVYPGVPPGFTPGPSPDRGVYAFHLGSDDPRDNTAVAVAAAQRAGVPLLVAGGWNGGGATALGRVSDDALRDLYRGAAAYVDPSLYEGFGYGVLEAMACATPVVASRTTSIPEVAGDAALLCDPRSSDQMAAALTCLLDDPALAASLRVRGLERAQLFTWEETAAGLSAAVNRALARDASP